MEEETKAFLLLIVNSIALMLLWMIANLVAGIYLGLAFFDGSPGWKNILYYAIAAITLVLVILRLVKKWKHLA